MQYKKIRNCTQTGDLICYNNNTFFGKIIRCITKQQATHIAICLWIERRLFILEALEWKGVIMSLASSRLTKWNIVSIRRKKGNFSKTKVLERGLSKLGMQYDWYINFGLLLKKVFKINIQMHHNKRYNCSEFWAYVNDLKETYVTPWDLLESKELKDIF